MSMPISPTLTLTLNDLNRIIMLFLPVGSMNTPLLGDAAIALTGTMVKFNEDGMRARMYGEAVVKGTLETRIMANIVLRDTGNHDKQVTEMALELESDLELKDLPVFEKAAGSAAVLLPVLKGGMNATTILVRSTVSAEGRWSLILTWRL